MAMPAGLAAWLAKNKGKSQPKISAKERKKSATVKVGGKSKFPIFNAATAEAAKEDEGLAKPPLTKAQKAAIDRKAAQFGK